MVFPIYADTQLNWSNGAFFLYGIFIEGVCHYIGVTKNLNQREIAHKHSQKWPDDVELTPLFYSFSSDEIRQKENEEISKIPHLKNSAQKSNYSKALASPTKPRKPYERVWPPRKYPPEQCCFSCGYYLRKKKFCRHCFVDERSYEDARYFIAPPSTLENTMADPAFL